LKLVAKGNKKFENVWEVLIEKFIKKTLVYLHRASYHGSECNVYLYGCS